MTLSVTVAVPTFQEEDSIVECLDAVMAQTYAGVTEILVVDGGSTDRTRALAAGRAGVRVLDNPRRIQAAALNLALAEARGDVLVRVDGHSRIAPDYVERCVAALERTGAAIVGGAMHPVGEGWLGRGIAAAMRSPLGAGPARFHTGGPEGWVDTVYLGAFRVAAAREVGGYSEDLAVNEDAEFAFRLRERGGVYFDPSIRSVYTPRATLPALARQFYRYGQGRAATVRRHPRSLAPRQLAPPLLVLGLLSPARRPVATAYGAGALAAGAWRCAHDPGSAAGFTLALPAMHVSWGLGFLRGLLSPQHPAS